MTMGTHSKVLVIGATSAIAQEVSKWFAAERAELFLVARNEDKLKAVADDLLVRGATRVEVLAADLTNTHRHAELRERTIATLGGLDVALVAHGTLPDQMQCQQDRDLTIAEFTTNCVSVVSLLTELANYFESQRRGCIAVISSVAGDRGRQSNYIYGAAKGAVSIFLQGLRGRLQRAGVTVLTIKPGFVDTPMTAAIPKNFLFARPERVGKKIFEAIVKRNDVLYVPWFWRWIMLVIKLIPERIFKKIPL